MKTSHALVAAALAAAACSNTALALTFQGASTQGSTVVTDYGSTGLASFDVDFANFGAATVTYRIDADDLGMPLELNAVLRNLTGFGLDGYTMRLSTGTWDSIGTVTRPFGGSATVNAAGGLATLAFTTPEFLDVEIGNAYGNTAGARDWTLAGLQSGNLLSITVSPVPEAGTWALLLSGLAALGWQARGRGRR